MGSPLHPSCQEAQSEILCQVAASLGSPLRSPCPSPLKRCLCFLIFFLYSMHNLRIVNPIILKYPELRIFLNVYTWVITTQNPLSCPLGQDPSRGTARLTAGSTGKLASLHENESRWYVLSVPGFSCSASRL